MFGISYPTVKNRLNRIARRLEFVETVEVSPDEEAIGGLERGRSPSTSTKEAGRMKRPPMLMHMRIQGERKGFGLWLPLFLLLPLALVVFIILSR